jgi:outer membrane protein
MNNVFTSVVAGILALASSSVVFSQTATYAYPLKYTDAIRLALTQRSEMAIEKINLDKAAKQLDESRAGLMPTLDFYSDVQRIKSYDNFTGIQANAVYNGVNVPISVNSLTQPYEVKAGLELNYKAYTGGRVQAQLNESQAAVRKTRATAALVHKKLILDVTKVYWELQKMQILSKTVQQSLAHAQSVLKIAQVQFDSGKISQLDLDAQKLTVEIRDIEVRDLARRQAHAQHHYRNALGFEARPPGESQTQELSSAAHEIDLDSFLVDLGLINSSEQDATLADIDAAQAQVLKVKSEFKPTLELFAGYGGIGRDSENVAGAFSAYGRDNFNMGFRLKWNLFNGHGSEARLSQALLAVQQTQLKAQQNKQSLSQAHQDQQSREEELKNQLLLLSKQAEFAQTELKISEKKLAHEKISTVQSHAAQLKAQEALDKVRLAQIDLFVARLEQRLAAQSNQN